MKICIIILIFALVIVGCVPGQVPIQIQVNQDSKEVIAKITARHVGYEIQKKYPDVAAKVLALSKDVLAAENDVIAAFINSLTSVLVNEVTDDPLLAMDIKDLASLVKIDASVEITGEQIKIFHAVAKGLISGIESYIKIIIP